MLSDGRSTANMTLEAASSNLTGSNLTNLTGCNLTGHPVRRAKSVKGWR
jgi:hypothetical protein